MARPRIDPREVVNDAELRLQRQAWLRRRFLWYLGVFGVLNLVFVTIQVDFGPKPADGEAATPLLIGGVVRLERLAAVVGIATALVYFVAFAYVLRVKRAPVMRIADWIVIGGGSLAILFLAMVAVSVGAAIDAGQLRTEHAIPGSVAALTTIMLAGPVQVGLNHFLACLFLPWTVREAVRPYVWLLGVQVAVTLVAAFWALMKGGPVGGIGLLVGIGVVGGLLSGLPGLGVCWWRYGRFVRKSADDAVHGRYSRITDELRAARRVHEQLFPAPFEDERAAFAYVYEPMQQLGGDFVFLTQDGEGRINLVLLDVTGHGVTAALTVNRLHGVLMRQFEERAPISPGEVVRHLNAYVRATMAGHSMYPVAFCARFDPASGALEYASAGHPPAIVVRAGGGEGSAARAVESLDSTTFVLGVVEGADFDPGEARATLGPGDALLVFTDGIYETRNLDGKQWGIAGVTGAVRALCGCPAGANGHAVGKGAATGMGVHNAGELCKELCRLAAQHRGGRDADDDLLVVELRRGSGIAATAVDG